MIRCGCGAKLNKRTAKQIEKLLSVKYWMSPGGYPVVFEKVCGDTLRAVLFDNNYTVCNDLKLTNYYKNEYALNFTSGQKAFFLNDLKKMTKKEIEKLICMMMSNIKETARHKIDAMESAARNLNLNVDWKGM